MSTNEHTMRALTADEERDYLSGYRTFPGAVETEHGVQVPTTDDAQETDAR